MRLKTFLPIAALLLPIALMTSCKDDDNDDLNPAILETSPENGAEDVARNQAITITFSEAMDESTINTSTFTLMQGDVSIEGTVETTATTATFTPTGSLSAEEDYTAILSTEVKTATGVAISEEIVIAFKTGGSTETVEAVDLGTAGDYVILAKTAINNSSTSVITGDLGLSPAATTFVTGFDHTAATGYATSAQVTGEIYAADMADPTPINLTTAVENMITAYNDAAGRSLIDFVELGTGDIGGKILAPGVYKWSTTVLIPTDTDVTISGSATDVWIFQIEKDLTVGTNAKIFLTGGALASNIFWQVAGQATLGTTSHFEGTILSMTGVTLQTGATYNGKILAQTAVVLDKNIVTMK
jgi:hypothetical protein